MGTMTIPLLILIFLDMALLIISSSFVSEHVLHMFQLNYYRYSEQYRWFKKNADRYIGHATLGVIMLIAVLIPWSPTVKAAIMLPLLAIGAIGSRPKKAKKPLVYTGRVKRILATLAVILLAACLIPFFCCFKEHQTVTLTVIALCFLLSPLAILLANLINKPIELAINRWYINDAKRILKERQDLTIIGITGSYGKTSVKYYLTSLLRSKFNVLMTPASFNTPMGVVKTVRNELKVTDEIFVCEMGAKWVGDIKELCDLVHPRHGMITSVGEQHLESMGSLENIKKTKFELAESLPNGGKLFINGNDENIADYTKSRTYNTVRYGLGGADRTDLDYRAEIVSCSSRGTVFIVTAPNGETQEYSTRLIGMHSVLNITGAVAVANYMGIELPALRGAIRRLEGVEHRLQLSEKNGATIIDDAYNSNPAGAKAAFEALGYFDGFKVVVTPGMVELGEKQFELNRQLGIDAAAAANYIVLVGQKQAEPILEGIKNAGFDENKVFVAGTIEQALAHAYAIKTEQKKIILLENDLPDNY